MINPNDFVITRKRKKYKFAKFANSPLCFEMHEWKHIQTDVIEVGAGTALFLVELAERQKNLSFVAVDVKADRLQKGAYEAEARGLSNIRFLRIRADQLSECFDPKSLQKIWLTFADPFPKKRSSGRRMSHPSFLKIYANLLRPNGSFILKHDDPTFFQWSLEQLVGSKWHIRSLTFDLHKSDMPDDCKVRSSYEIRWLGEGRIIQLVEATTTT